MKLQIIQVPYDSGHADTRTGRGPAHFLDHGLDRLLRADGHHVDVEHIASHLVMPTEIGTMIDTNRLLAGRVRNAIDQGRLPLVLAGNCNSCVGTLAGVDTHRLGIIWFDTHGDFNTPETTTTGFLDGMGLAMASGRCWKALLGTIPGWEPVADRCIVHIGSRDLDAAEKGLLMAANIPLVVADAALFAGLDMALAKIKEHVDRIYLHVDMDVMDTGRGQPNGLALPGGLHPQAVEAAIRTLKTHFTVAAAAIASFDPDYDRGNSVLDAGMRVIQSIVAD